VAGPDDGGARLIAGPDGAGASGTLVGGTGGGFSLKNWAAAGWVINRHDSANSHAKRTTRLTVWPSCRRIVMRLFFH
jgi:hypothetical protein